MTIIEWAVIAASLCILICPLVNLHDEWWNRKRNGK